MSRRILFDSGFVVAFNNPADSLYRQAVHFLERNSRADYLLPEVALTEITYLLEKAGGQDAATRFMDRLAEQQTPLQSVTHVDLARASRIKKQYADAEFDFVDCCIMALSEGMNITQVCTFDRRDFSIFRPRHTDFFELLP